MSALVRSQLWLLCCGAQAGDGTGHEPGDLGQVSAVCGGSHAGLRGLTQGPESPPRSKGLACLHTSKTSQCSYV